MPRFRLVFLAIALALLVPVAVLVHRALRSVALERQLHHQTVAERVFDEMERGLSRVLDEEERQSFEEYGADVHSAWPFVIGRFQIDPDGEVHALPATVDKAEGRDEIVRSVDAYWRGGRARPQAAAPPAGQVPGTTVALQRFAAPRQQRVADDDALARQQSKDVSAYDVLRSLNKAGLERSERRQEEADGIAEIAPGAPPEREVAANEHTDGAEMTGRVIDARQLMLFRTVVRDRQGYRQGALIDIDRLGDWLRDQGLGSDGVRAYAAVSFATQSGASSPAALPDAYVYQHRFAEPFDDLTARLALQPLPGSGSAVYVYTLAALVLAAGVLGLGALYRMVSVTVAFAERRNNFVAAVSHELKTPLTAIRMYSEMLRDGLVPSEAKRDEYHRHITAESERLSRLINNVLEFARLEKGTRQVAVVTRSPAAMLRELAQLVRSHVEAEGFELSLAIDDAVPAIRFEPDALMQVLWNLVDNAVKYARDGSPRRIELRCAADGGSVHVTVRDHGPGVATRHAGRIFEPFYRGEDELTRRSKGTGLGLALVRGLVERMGATVAGRNAPDGGFEVTISFDVAS